MVVGKGDGKPYFCLLFSPIFHHIQGKSGKTVNHFILSIDLKWVFKSGAAMQCNLMCDPIDY